MAMQTSSQAISSTISGMKLVPIPTTVKLPSSSTLITREVDKSNYYPCRRCLTRGLIGEKMHLILYNPFPNSESTQSPYVVPSPIFIHSHECQIYEGSLKEGQVPEYLNLKMALRAYDSGDMMVAFGVVDGKNERELVEMARNMFEDEKVVYLNVYNAGPGCFAVRVERE